MPELTRRTLGESPRQPARALAIFGFSLALGIAGLFLVAGDQIFRIETYRVREPGALIIALCMSAFLIEWFVMDPARIWLLCRNQKIPLPFRSAVLVHLTSMFVASITPGNAAVGPATAVALRRLGVPFGKSVGVAIQVLIFDMIFFAWAVPLSLGYLIYSDTLRLPPGSEFAAFVTAGLAIVGAVFLTHYPRPVVRLILAVSRWRLTARFTSPLRKIARDYYRSARAFLKMPASYWLALHLATAAGWFGGFVLFWLLLKLYGVEAGLLATLAILSSITLVSHVVPTPGASGFMEAAVGRSIGTKPGAAAALLVWRLASFYVVFLLGPPAGWLLYLSRPAASRARGRRKPR
jgi:glycosyltransferase 2 family protein